MILRGNIVIILFASILTPYASASYRLNLLQRSSKVFNFDFIDINLLKNNDDSLRKFTTERSIELPVDHFNGSDHRKYKMRYFENLSYFKKNGPIIFEMGLESPSTDQFLDYSIDLARETSGALYLNEHRYYGESYPLPVRNYKDFDNYKYLSARQSLADVASLLKMLKERPEYKNSKVVAVGGSYGGNLASWVRQLYPHLVDAAHASSAPVLAKDDYFEYLEKVSDDLKKYCKPKDFNRIRSLFKRRDELIKTDAGMKKLKKELNICEDFDLHIPHNQHTLFLSLVLDFESMAQYGSPSLFIEKCPEIGLGAPSTCFNTTIADEIRAMRNAPYSWDYQKCNEFGYFKTLSSKAQIFTNQLTTDYFHTVCKGVFGPEFGEERVKRGIEEVNKMYGGKTPNVTRVVFVNGDLDPWSRLGITQDLSPEAPARLLHGTSHCQDLVTQDKENIREVRAFSKKMIKKWIGL